VGNNPHIYFDGDCFEKYHVNTIVHKCSNVGLISNSFSTKYAEGSSERRLIFHTNNLCCLANAPHPYRYNVVAFNNVGLELFTLLDYKCNEQFVFDCFRSMRKHIPELDLKIHRINENGGSVLLYDPIPLEID
jgi:hypothetical protein